MKSIQFLLILLLLASCGKQEQQNDSQNQGSVQLADEVYSQSHHSAENLANSLFYAAQTQDISKVNSICHPTKLLTEDAKRLAKMTEADASIFQQKFQDAHISGEIIYSGDREAAEIPIAYDREGKKQGVITLEKLNGKWLLVAI